MKTIIALLIASATLVSCTKSYYLPKANEVIVTITGETYLTTVNGSTGYCWKLKAAISEPLSKAIHLVYLFDDNAGLKGMDVPHDITAGGTENTFITQWPASGSSAKISKVYSLTVTGANEYTFKLK
jgi:hypothetical protein